MNTIIHFIRLFMLAVLILTRFVASTLAQEVSIPDPGLNAAIRSALQKPSGPLTEQDLLSLTNLEGNGRNISSVEGLETASNLALLRLASHPHTNFALYSNLTNLTALAISF